MGLKKKVYDYIESYCNQYLKCSYDLFSEFFLRNQSVEVQSKYSYLWYLEEIDRRIKESKNFNNLVSFNEGDEKDV